MLQHLSDPVAALREMARVCKPDGLVAVRDSDYSSFTWWPAVPELDEWLDLYRAVARGNDAEPDAGRRLKSWALAAGLWAPLSTAGVWCFSSPEDVGWWGGMWAERIVSSSMAEQAVERGLAKHRGPGTAVAGMANMGWVRRTRGSSSSSGELLCSPHARHDPLMGAMVPAPEPLTLATWPTPVEPAPRRAQAIGLGADDLWVKRDDLVGLGGGGNKVRKLQYLCAAAIAAGARTLVTTGAAQSNHARLTAAAAACLGLDVERFLAGHAPDPEVDPTGNLLLDRLFGARLIWAGDIAHEDLEGVAASRVAERDSEWDASRADSVRRRQRHWRTGLRGGRDTSSSARWATYPMSLWPWGLPAPRPDW